MDPTPKLRILALAALAASIALAQPPASRPLVFDVATVRPAKAQRGAGIFFTPDGARANGSPLKYIIRSAYGENRDAPWFDEPAWTDTALYDIEAKFDPTAFKDLTDEQRRAVMQALLADRFKLVVHRETRVLPLYNLVVAKGGPKLRCVCGAAAGGVRSGLREPGAHEPQCAGAPGQPDSGAEGAE